MMIEQGAKLTKADIKRTAPLMGCVNAERYNVGDFAYLPGELRFIAFAGAINADGLFHGVYRFEKPGEDEEESPSGDFGLLFPPAAATGATTPRKGVSSDVV
jgi:hypothetical protein